MLKAPTGATAQLLTMNGGTFQGNGGQSLLNLPNASNTITAGTFDNVILSVGTLNGLSGSSLTIDGNMTLKNGATISVIAPAQGGNPNTLNWQSGSIATPATATGVSSSSITNSGTLYINSNGTLGDAASLTQIRLTNAGTLNVYSTPIISGSFTNAGTLSLRSASNLQVQGAASQSAGTTSLQGGTLTNSVYNVNGGSLVGNGTIAANLVLGGNGNNPPVTLSPGIFGTSIGTITVTNSMAIYTTNAVTNIEVTSTGANDQIVVQGQGGGGWAILNGTLNVTFDSPQYSPADNTTLVFITASTFIDPNTNKNTDFSSPKNFGQGWQNPGNVHYTSWKAVQNPGSYALVATPPPPK